MVVLDVSPFIGVNSLVDSGMSHINANSLPKGTRNGVGGVNPTIRVEDIFGYVFGMHTVDGISNILSRGDNKRKGQHKGHRYRIVQPEYGRVYGDTTLLNKGLLSAKYI